ncbi:MAG: DUF4242 domain-containing protein [Gammaproteobacteria bacterium]|jgi:hypothetical protein|nr:DUF4242 domain-containing protein [Gammaproteobacteria bacterium]
MPRFVIERDIPEIGSADRDALRGASQKSNSVLASMKKDSKNIQWEHSYVTADKIFCVYLADTEALILEHANESGFPASKVSQVVNVIDPVTAEA